ncbi:hypothetical protein A7M79_00980 [Acinetobacter baumannii]|uniref:DMT family transporter n=1 Tax=Acinetobacter baumannii TaxID=470 RepID=UPI0008DD55AD|nr:SMR family transporter [Acinetobacter baumannii]OIH12092.1 hypothetical protein A7M79_00980 [Acinetobacter baumannii]
MLVGYFLLALAIATDVLSTVLSAKADGLSEKATQIIALVFCILSFVASAIALKYIKAGYLYVLWTGIGAVGTILISWIYLNQKMNLAGLVGVIFIVIGVTIVTAFGDVDI